MHCLHNITAPWFASLRQSGSWIWASGGGGSKGEPLVQRFVFEDIMRHYASIAEYLSTAMTLILVMRIDLNRTNMYKI